MALLASGRSTTDPLVLNVYRQIRRCSGLAWDELSISYRDVIKERRVEFALESVNYFDVKRMSYRNMDHALSYLNGMQRHRMYVSNGGFNWQERNAQGAYHGGFNVVDPSEDPTGKGSIFFLNKDAAVINITSSNLVLPIPAETITKTPSILQEPVGY